MLYSDYGMKIGLFTDTYAPQINGVTTVIQMMEKEFKALGHEPIVFAPSYPDQPETEGPEVWRFPSRQVNFHPESRMTWPYRRKIPSILSELDVIHSHTLFSVGLLGLWAARHYNIPHVHTYHTFFTEYRHYIPRPIRPSVKMTERISRAFCNRCDLILAPSKEMKQELGNYEFSTPVEAMPFGIDLDTFSQPIRRDLKKNFNLSANTKVLLTCGRLGAEKNFSFVMDSFAQLKKQFDDVVLVIAGDGPAREDLERQAKDLGVQDAVRFLGYVDRSELVDYYPQADLFVFASKTETQGIVLLESQASGTPVVAIGEMGVLDVVNDGQSGYLVKEDLDAFTASVFELLTDDEKHKAFSKGALELAQQHSAQKTCKALMKKYEQLLNHSAAVPMS